jgi:hypothetical protein
VYISAKRVEALERAIEAKRLFDEEQARLAAQAFATEERLAWDHYAAGATIAGVVNSITPMLAAKWADHLLEERRKRFGSSAK